MAMSIECLEIDRYRVNVGKMSGVCLVGTGEMGPLECRSLTFYVNFAVAGQDCGSFAVSGTVLLFALHYSFS